MYCGMKVMPSSWFICLYHYSAMVYVGHGFILLGEADSLLNFIRREFGCCTVVFLFLAGFFHLATWPGALQYIFLQNAVDKYWIQSTRFSCWQCRCIFLYTLSWSLDANCYWEWSDGAFLKSELILHHKAAVHKDLVFLAMQSAVFSVVMTRIPGY